MKVVVDSNIVFSAMLNRGSSIGDIILNSQETLDFCTCEFLLGEIGRHKERIINITGFREEEYKELELLIYRQISFFSESTIPFEYWIKAANLVRDTDMDDISFVALSLFLDIKLWTGDKALIDGLTKKGYTNIITTQEMLKAR